MKLLDRVHRTLKYAWAAPTTLLGVLASLSSLALPGRSGGILLCRSRRGFAGWFLARRGYCAITLGHAVILTTDAPEDVIAHELVHVRQGERWGPFFVPAYLIAMLAVRLRGGNAYWDNPFESEARQKSSPEAPPG